MSRYTLTSILLGSVLLAGCGSNLPSVQVFPVTGVVQHDGKPIAEASVVFHPDVPLPAGIHHPLAMTDAEGRFALTTLKPGDGAPVGDYRITVELRAKRMAGEELVRDGAHLLPEKYAHPKTTPLRFTVKPEANEVPAILLSK